MFKTTANSHYRLPLLTFQELPETESETPGPLDREPASPLTHIT